MKMKIVLGVDGSEPANRAVEWCAKYARALDAEVIAVHAIDLPFLATVPTPFVPAPLPLADHAELRDRATNDWCAHLASSNVPFRVVLMDGDPALVIMQAAKSEPADLVVVGRRARGGFTELVLDNASYVLIHYLDRPLLIVP